MLRVEEKVMGDKVDEQGSKYLSQQRAARCYVALRDVTS